MERQAAEDLLGSLYQARLLGQLDRLCSLFAADARFRIVGNSDGRPIAISARGSREIHSWLSMLMKTIKLAQHEIISMTLDGSRAAVHWRANVFSKVTGAQQPTEFVDLVQMDEGRIVSYIEFFVPC